MRLLRSLLLPFSVVLVIPFFLITRFGPFRLIYVILFPAIQLILGSLCFLLGLLTLIVTIRLFAIVGKGTLAPWDPTKKLVAQGIYRYTRNPMITGVAFMVFGEAVFFGSMTVWVWFVVIIVVNTIYFKVSEEPGLVKRFGQEYVDYRREVPMWLPRLKPWDPSNKDRTPKKKS
jgi:protein-S-isoprenylcysteine O-methyltransferase Ste14